LAVHDPAEIDALHNAKSHELEPVKLINNQFQGLAHLVQKLSDRPVVNYNQVLGLHNGEEAYPPMLEAIRNAKHYILLTTYIFESNGTGLEFINALVEAHNRQVQVKIIIDGLGEFYSWPHAGKLLQKQGIQVERFDEPKLWPLNISLNLRSHRKSLIVDGAIAFVGSMNIGGRHMAYNPKNHSPVIDMQFQVEGPIVKQCEAIFCEDWRYITQKNLEFPATLSTTNKGYALCRAIEDGPDEYLGHLSTLIVNAVAIAQKSVWIMTPYFLPSLELTNALQAAALRGVKVNILLPKKNNLPYVKWASTHMLPRLLSYGVRIYMQPAPFVHTKLFVVDQYYSLLGSANIDPRSLRLNFELGIEVYDVDVAEKLIAHCAACQLNSKPVTLAELEQQPLVKKIRNAIFWLFYPYL
ncbi:MAG: phosphatidylserine/phosphatidylglycerophosphate/cardiolipin synthase family protein, partial [Gammaproteobacteria bacterium]